MTTKDLLIKAIIEDYSQTLRIAMRISSMDIQRAEDTVQGFVQHLLDKDNLPEQIDNIKGYLRVSLKHYILNELDVYDNRNHAAAMQSSDLVIERGSSVWEDTMDEAYDFQKVMKIAHEKLPPAQLRAIKETLKHDNLMVSIDGSCGETTKANRRQGILKLQKELAG